MLTVGVTVIEAVTVVVVVVVGDTLMVVVMVTVGVADAEGDRVSVGVMLAEIVGVGEVAVTHEVMHVEPERVPPLGQLYTGVADWVIVQVEPPGDPPLGHEYPVNVAPR